MAARKHVEPVLATKPMPTHPLRVGRVAEPAPQPAVAPSIVACVCKACQSSNGSVLSGKYGYYFKCLACSANTAIRFTCQPGHVPRLRGERGAFYRDCPQCATSVLYHRNQTAEPAR